MEVSHGDQHEKTPCGSQSKPCALEITLSGRLPSNFNHLVYAVGNRSVRARKFICIEWGCERVAGGMAPKTDHQLDSGGVP